MHIYVYFLFYFIKKVQRIPGATMNDILRAICKLSAFNTLRLDVLRAMGQVYFVDTRNSAIVWIKIRNLELSMVFLKYPREFVACQNVLFLFYFFFSGCLCLMFMLVKVHKNFFSHIFQNPFPLYSSYSYTWFFFLYVYTL